MTLTVDHKLGVWTLVVANSVFIVSSVVITFRLIIHCSHKPVALAVNGIISTGTVELLIVAGVTGLTLRAMCYEVSTDVPAR